MRPTPLVLALCLSACASRARPASPPTVAPPPAARAEPAPTTPEAPAEPAPSPEVDRSASAAAASSPDAPPPVAEPTREEPVKIDTRELVGTRVVHVGDSFVQAGLAQALRVRLRELGARYSVLSRTSAYTTTFVHDDELGALLSPKPDLVLVTLGANEFESPAPSAHAPAIRALVKRIGASPCVWVAPVSWKKDTGILDVVRANVAPCVYFDSDALVGDVPRQRDHIHPSAEGGARWADALFRWLIDHRKSGAKWAIQPRP